MATKKTAYIDVNFAITVRVPVDLSRLPEGVEEGDDISSLISTDLWDDIVNESLDVMDGPNAGNIDSMVVEEIEGDDDGETEEENDEDLYNDSEEYIHDAALDWFYDHADDYEDDDEAIEACKDALIDEGYYVNRHPEAVEEAWEDYIG
jgi:hypothetical protein